MHSRSQTLVPWMTRGQALARTARVTGGKGSYFYINNGAAEAEAERKILDFTSGAVACNLGHSHPGVKSSMLRHIEGGLSYTPLNFKTDSVESLTEKIISACPGYDSVYYTNAGADANEGADFIAREWSRLMGRTRKRSLALSRSFHGGSTIGASLLGGDQRRLNKVNHYQLPFHPVVPNPGPMGVSGEESLDRLEKEFQIGDVASFIFEGSSGSVGCYPYPDDYLREVLDLCQAHKVVSICDEVMSGWGRTGSLFAHTRSNGPARGPDIITTAKGITGGYAPLGAIIVSSPISQMFNSEPLMYGLTYSGHPLSCTIANACFDAYSHNDWELFRGIQVRSDYLRNLGWDIVEKYKQVEDFRLDGLLGCFQLNMSDQELEHLSMELFSRDIFCLRIREHLMVAPPLNVSFDEIDQGMNGIDEALGVSRRQRHLYLRNAFPAPANCAEPALMPNWYPNQFILAMAPVIG